MAERVSVVPGRFAADNSLLATVALRLAGTVTDVHKGAERRASIRFWRRWLAITVSFPAFMIRTACPAEELNAVMAMTGKERQFPSRLRASGTTFHHTLGILIVCEATRHREGSIQAAGASRPRNTPQFHIHSRGAKAASVR